MSGWLERLRPRRAAERRLAEICAAIYHAFDRDERIREEGNPDEVARSQVELDRLYRKRREAIEFYATRWGRR